MNELNDLINQIKIPLKNQHIHELYLYATYQRFDKKEETKKKLTAMVNQERHKVDVSAVAEWLHTKIEAGEIKIVTKPINRPFKSFSATSVPKSRKNV
jgi:ATP sulfurylase